MNGVATALIGSLAIAAVSTLGDFIWATWIPRHRMPYGLTHGTLLFLCIGLFLGSLGGRPLAGALAGALTGAFAAGAFYLLAPFFGYAVMFFVWFDIWITLGVLLPALTGRRIALLEALGRGGLAALTSGVAFYAVSGIWSPFNPSGIWDYTVHFSAWTLAYLPGFAALIVRGEEAGNAPRTG